VHKIKPTPDDLPCTHFHVPYLFFIMQLIQSLRLTQKHIQDAIEFVKIPQTPNVLLHDCVKNTYTD
jgi:hypothetical protein